MSRLWIVMGLVIVTGCSQTTPSLVAPAPASEIALLRANLKAHLGEPLFARIAGAPYLSEQRKANDAPLAAEQLHELSHRIVRGLLTSHRGSLPPWLEEGLCRYLTMHLQRWKDKRWDARAELEARLAWDDPGLRQELLAWRSEEALDERLSQGSLGFVLAMESEVGSGALLEILKQLFVASPETDEETVRFLEAKLRKPIGAVGHLPSDIRDRIAASLVRASG